MVPLLNSAVMMLWVDAVTLCVAHIEGYAGVMIGMRCVLSAGYNYCQHINRVPYIEADFDKPWDSTLAPVGVLLLLA
jgi:hypothetical protein